MMRLVPLFLVPSLITGLSTNVSPVDAAVQDRVQNNTVRITPTRVYDRAENFLKEDSRLQKRVAVDKPFVYLGELLEALAEQTGVEITASDSDGAASEELTAVLADISLADAMESLSSLLSHEGMLWRWRREGDGSEARPYVYRLLRPAEKLSAYAARAKEKIQSEYEKEADLMIAGLDMSQEELKRKAKEHPALNYLIRGNETPHGVKAFRDSLTPEQRLQVLRDWNKGIRIPLSELHPSGKQAEAYMHNDARQLNPGRTFNVESAYFWTSVTDGIPNMVIGFDELGGWGYLGGKKLKEAEQKRNEKDWQRGDESTQNPEEETGRLPPPKDRKQTSREPGRGTLPGRLQYLAKEGGFSLLARFKRDDNSVASTEPWDMPLAEYLADMKAMNNMIQKWRKTSDGRPLLLLDYMAWYKQDTDPQHPRLPWGIVKRLRADRSKNTNESMMNSMLLAGGNLNEQQLLRLEQGEFPMMETLRSYNWFYGPLITWLQSNPNEYKLALSDRGASTAKMSPRLQNHLQALVLNPATPNISVTPERVRFVIADEADPGASWRIESLDDKGNVIGVRMLPKWKAK